MQTPAQQPETERQQVTEAVMSSQGYTSVSTCSCFLTRIIVAMALKSLFILFPSLLCAAYVNTEGSYILIRNKDLCRCVGL